MSVKTISRTNKDGSNVAMSSLPIMYGTRERVMLGLGLNMVIVESLKNREF